MSVTNSSRGRNLLSAIGGLNVNQRPEVLGEGGKSAGLYNSSC